MVGEARVPGDAFAHHAGLLRLEALSVDPANTGALCNLAFLDMIDGQWQRAIDRYEEALPRIIERDEGAELSNTMDRQWYRCQYNFGVAHFHYGCRYDPSATSYLSALRTRPGRSSSEHLQARDNKPDPSLKGFLSTAAQTALVVLADVRSRRPATPSDDAPPRAADATPSGDEPASQVTTADIAALTPERIISYIYGPE